MEKGQKHLTLVYEGDPLCFQTVGIPPKPGDVLSEAPVRTVWPVKKDLWSRRNGGRYLSLHRRARQPAYGRGDRLRTNDRRRANPSPEADY
jgi:hypothetical protein